MARGTGASEDEPSSIGRRAIVRAGAGWSRASGRGIPSREGTDPAAAGGRQLTRDRPISADPFERVLAYGSIGLLILVTLAVVRGSAEWARVPLVVWAHLLTVLIAVALTPVLLLRPRGSRGHRVLGRIWVAAMFATALTSLFIPGKGPYGLSPIHMLSAGVLVLAPVIWWSARSHRVGIHRKAVCGTVLGALLLAGSFAFPFGRLLGRWLIE